MNVFKINDIVEVVRVIHTLDPVRDADKMKLLGRAFAIYSIDRNNTDCPDQIYRFRFCDFPFHANELRKVQFNSLPAVGDDVFVADAPGIHKVTRVEVLVSYMEKENDDDGEEEYVRGCSHFFRAATKEERAANIAKQRDALQAELQTTMEKAMKINEQLAKLAQH
jgi:hypothetical protein